MVWWYWLIYAILFVIFILLCISVYKSIKYEYCAWKVHMGKCSGRIPCDMGYGQFCSFWFRGYTLNPETFNQSGTRYRSGVDATGRAYQPPFCPDCTAEPLPIV